MANERPIPTSLPEWQKATNRRIAMLERAVNTRARISQVSTNLDGKMPVYWAGQDGYAATAVPTDFPTGITYFYVLDSAWPGNDAQNRLVRVTKYKNVDTMAVQEVFDQRGGGDVSTRVAAPGGGWTAWTEAASKSYVDGKTWDAATDLTGIISDTNLPTRLGSGAEQVTDFNSAQWNGWYRGNNAANAPAGSSWYYVEAIRHDASYIVQTGYDYFSDKMYFRRKQGGTWQAWQEIPLKSQVALSVYTRVYTSSATYTPPSTLAYAIIEVQGGGGSGSGAGANSSTQVCSGNGGGGGGYARGALTKGEMGSSVSVTVGAGGAGDNDNQGAAGGTSAFGGWLTATGGLAGGRRGPSTTYWGRGGTLGSGGSGGGSLGDKVTANGATGGAGLGIGPSNWAQGGDGGDSMLGKGGVGGGPTGSGSGGSGISGTGYGGGGGGAGNNYSASAQAGGSGSDGCVIITEFHNV